ncbi:MAG: hypothetical protein JXR94_02550 [Candidatus Hydrogenedentes bacterium]|nr:hypothetical protein [Candidatus Hydrogenedentota bacterium]
MGGGRWRASEWIRRLEKPDSEVRAALEAVYGGGVDARAALVRRAAARFIERFGDGPMRVFRSPGRINLRGMHVDTHGGYLNLMTHQREVVVAVAPGPADDDTATFVNVDPAFEEVAFRLGGQAGHPAFDGDWFGFITRREIQESVLAQRGHWGNYLRGVLLRMHHEFRDAPLRGLSGVVASDLPRGAALSSSMALCVAAFHAAMALHGRKLADDALIRAVQGAEWYTGSRCGTSDQAAMILGGRDELVNVALLAEDLDSSGARRIRFPDGLGVLVINSYTERSISGAALGEYTRNRFAYSLALAILRQEMAAEGWPEALVRGCGRLSALTPDAFAEYGGGTGLLRLLRRIPESLSLDQLKGRYDLPGLDAAYEQYFGTVAEAHRPKDIGLRGPLLFGIAESERARVFADALESGDWERAGRLMTTGHDGDRRVCADGTPFRYDVGDGALERLVTDGAAIEDCPGVYGASSPVLDSLVDAALAGGALGASLTGAGIAGTVLALCRREDIEHVQGRILNWMGTEDYGRLAGRDGTLSEAELAGAVVVNRAPAAAGELGPFVHRES